MNGEHVIGALDLVVVVQMEVGDDDDLVEVEKAQEYCVYCEGCKEWLRRIDTRKCTMNCTKLDKRLAKRCGKMRK